MYVVAIIFAILIFITVLIVACTSKKHQPYDPNQQEIDSELDNASDSLEIKITLDPTDFDRWMPKISYLKMIEKKSKMF